MLILNIILGAAFITGIAVAFRYAQVAKRQQKINMIISAGLDDLMTATRNEVKKNTALIEQAKEALGMKGSQGISSNTLPPEKLNSPQLLSSVLTVIVAKLGHIRLSAADFDVVNEGDYVSVYVDINTQDLILSLRHDLEDISSLAFAPNPDVDDTFH